MAGRVLITGASGFLGRALADRYRAAGAEVRGVDRVADLERGVVAGDVAVPGPWQDRAAGCDLVVHTAAIVSLRTSRRAETWRANVLGTRHALDAAERAGARLVHLSTVVVFGTAFPDGVDESHPVAITGLPYGDTKVAAEQLLLQAQLERGAEVVVVRPGDVYGPGSRAWAAIPAELLRRRRLLLPAGGRGIFSPVYVDDLVDGVVLAGEHPDAPGQVFTLAGGAGVPTAEFFAPYAELVHRRLPVAPTAVALAAARLRHALPGDEEVNAHAVRYLARTGTYSIARARTRLGYAPRVELADGLERTVAWLRDRL